MPKSKKVTVDNLAEAIEEILEDYSKDTRENMDEITKAVAKKGVQALKSASSIFGGSGKYKSGWAVDFEVRRYGSTAYIWNKKAPGLPHLLEHGHANRGGGRTPGREHIAPVAEELVEEFRKQLEKKL